MKKSSRVTCVLPILLAALIVACGNNEEKKDGAGAEGPVFAVNTIYAAQGPIQDYITFSGDIVSGSTIDVYPEAAGKVTEVYVSSGRRVNRGDRIASVDPSRPGMTFRQNIATAPISGTIVMVPAQVGMTVSQAVPLARISGGAGLEIKINVSERFISRIALNQPCEIRLDAWPGEVFKGSVTEVAPTVDIASRTMEARIIVSDSSNKLKPGMFAKVSVVTEVKENIVKIPLSAIISRFGEQYIYIVENNPEKPDSFIVKKRIVTTGILIDGIVEIREGLSPGEEVVVRGQTLLDDNSNVNVIERLNTIKDE